MQGAFSGIKMAIKNCAEAQQLITLHHVFVIQVFRSFGPDGRLAGDIWMMIHRPV
ncbi:hypothetical protein [Komagataeibacter melaceti]|uniref:hypothetical protein n=1 Tax=Komagataeibacter melaceti TaxID=2766577 RepID=UPI001313D8EE|nr:hypothetical protein [Komagataeibacter melaceti]